MCNKKLAGIISFGTKVCAEGYPDVYTNVSSFVCKLTLLHQNQVITKLISFLAWINSNMFMRSVFEGSNDVINELAAKLPAAFH